MYAQVASSGTNSKNKNTFYYSTTNSTGKLIIPKLPIFIDAENADLNHHSSDSTKLAQKL
jgi:hypothetical protein